MTIARFVRGSTTFDLSTFPYALGGDFIPPAAVMAYNMAGGTSANQYGGSVAVSQKAANADVQFSVRITGPTGTSSNSYINHAARRLVQFLKAGDSDPLYFEWEATGLPEPLWGQFGAAKRYEVATIDAQMGSEYSDPVLRTSGVLVYISASFRPFVLGTKQRLASALGGVWLDNIGSATGEAWGLRINWAIGNKLTNPIFGHSTWNNDWVASAAVVAVQNTDERYCMPGSASSALLYCNGIANTYYESINVGGVATHYFYAICARPDGAAVTAADAQIFYNGVVLANTYRSLGNGLYMLSASAAGVAAPAAAGLSLGAGRSVYLLGMRVDESPIPVVVNGDMLGHAWATTAHDSATTSTTGRVRLAVANDTFRAGQWSIRVVWKTDFSAAAAANMYFFSCGAGSIEGWFATADNKIYLTDGTNTIASAAQTFSAFDTLDLIFTAGPLGLNIYKNGAGAASGATYTPPAAPSYIYIGTDSAAANHSYGLYQAFETYAVELTSTQITAIYNASLPLISAGYKIGDIPWMWTKDGDDTFDNCNDGTYDNWGVVAGLAGDMAARVEIDGVYGAMNSGANNILLSNIDLKYFINPSGFLFYDQGGNASATCSNADYAQTLVNNVALSIAPTTTALNKQKYIALAGRELMAVVRTGPAGDAGANLSIQFTTAYTLVASAAVASKAIAGDNQYVYFTKTMHLPMRETGSRNTIMNDYFQLYGVRSVAGAANVDIDFFNVFNDPINVLGAPASGFLLTADGIAYARTMYTDTRQAIETRGNMPVFVPGRWNLLQILIGKDAVSHIVDDTATINLWSTPRWSLL